VLPEGPLHTPSVPRFSRRREDESPRSCRRPPHRRLPPLAPLRRLATAVAAPPPLASLGSPKTIRPGHGLGRPAWLP
jgi:hypothetical protein